MTRKLITIIPRYSGEHVFDNFEANIHGIVATFVKHRPNRNDYPTAFYNFETKKWVEIWEGDSKFAIDNVRLFEHGFVMSVYDFDNVE